MGDFHFMYPHWLWLLLLIPLLWSRALLRRQNDGEWSGIVDEQLAPFVLTGRNRKSGFQVLTVISLLTVLAILAIAGPSWEKREIPAFRKQEAVVVGLDLSASMYARDATPNRLDAARFKLLDLLKTRKDGQTGLVVFAGDAFTVSPLTDDTATINAQVKSLSPEIMPVQGSYVDLAITRAIEVLDQAAFGEGNILLITDGVTDIRLAQTAAQQAVARGYTVSVLGVGTEQGAPIPMREGGFMIDSTGKTILPKLEIVPLKAIANAGKGVFATATLNDSDINRLAKHWENQQGGDELVGDEERQLDAWFNQGVWLVLLLIPVAMLFFRRGWLTVFLLAILLRHPDTAEASAWDNLWLTPDQQGQKMLAEGDAATANQLFSDPDWKAAAAYRAGDYAQAAQLYALNETTQGLYNYGNALAMQGKLQQAIAAYEEVLAQNPEHEDAQHNLEQLKKRQEEQQQQSQGQQSQQNNASRQQNGEGQQSENADSQSAQEGQEQNANPGEQEEQQEGKSSEKEGEGDKQSASDQEAEDAPDAQTREQKQATEQWLRRIPDDPAGLWRRKFQYQYRQRPGRQKGESW